MKKRMKTILSAVLAVVLLVGVVLGYLFVDSQNYEIPDQAETIANDTGLIQAHGRSLYDAQGNAIHLKGINAGQLLLQEGWMSPFATEPLKNADGSYVKDGDGNIQYPEFTEMELRQALTQMIDGTVMPEAPGALQDLYHSLLLGDYGSMGDPYFVLKDFGSYSMANRRMMEDYMNRDKWLKMAVTNTAMSGFFSSDRTIAQYNRDIWHL